VKVRVRVALCSVPGQKEQIWNVAKVGAICGDNPGGGGLSGARKRIGSPQQGAEERGQRARPFEIRWHSEWRAAMAGSVNKVILVGNLGKDPEIRRTQDGRPIANLSIATSETWRDKNTGERKEKTEWHRVVIFSEPLCKIVEQYLKKGAKVYIEGALQTRKYTDQSGSEARPRCKPWRPSSDTVRRSCKAAPRRSRRDATRSSPCARRCSCHARSPRWRCSNSQSAARPGSGGFQDPCRDFQPE